MSMLAGEILITDNFVSIIPQNPIYSGDLKSRLVWILNGQEEIGLQMVQILNGIWDPEAQPFEIQTNGCHFVKNHFEWLGQ